MEEIMRYWPVLLPVVLIQWGLQVGAVVSLVKRKKVKFDNKVLWGLIIVCGGVLGAIVYFVARGDEE